MSSEPHDIEVVKMAVKLTVLLGVRSLNLPLCRDPAETLGGFWHTVCSNNCFFKTRFPY